MATSTPHRDHDGHGTLIHYMFRYKIWISWPNMTEVDRLRFLKDGTHFSGRGARWLVIGPGDQYIQTPCGSPDVHAVISLGYCGVSTCVEKCVKTGHPDAVAW